jgi:hypothetical protein
MPRATLYPAVASIKMSNEQLRLINQRAKQCGVRPSVWMRTVLMRVAQSAAENRSDGYIRIREPDGVTT